jgi:hypothetical protein
VKSKNKYYEWLFTWIFWKEYLSRVSSTDLLGFRFQSLQDCRTQNFGHRKAVK